MRGVLVQSTDTLRVDDQHIDGLTVWSLANDWSSPDPKTLKSGDGDKSQILDCLVTLVQGLMVGPTPKPEERLRRTLLRRYDFPVLYIPATATIPMLPEIEARNSMASSLIVNSEKGERREQD